MPLTLTENLVVSHQRSTECRLIQQIELRAADDSRTQSVRTLGERIDLEPPR